MFRLKHRRPHPFSLSPRPRWSCCCCWALRRGEGRLNPVRPGDLGRRGRARGGRRRGAGLPGLGHADRADRRARRSSGPSGGSDLAGGGARPGRRSGLLAATSRAPSGAASAQLRLWSLTDGGEPVALGKVIDLPGKEVGAVAIGYARAVVLTARGVTVLRLKDPEAPTLEAEFAAPGLPPALGAWDGRIALAGGRAWLARPSGSGIPGPVSLGVGAPKPGHTAARPRGRPAMSPPPARGSSPCGPTAG